MVAVAQSVERQVVVLDVAGSRPVCHPRFARIIHKRAVVSDVKGHHTDVSKLEKLGVSKTAVCGFESHRPYESRKCWFESNSQSSKESLADRSVPVHGERPVREWSSDRHFVYGEGHR